MKKISHKNWIFISPYLGGYDYRATLFTYFLRFYKGFRFNLASFISRCLKSTFQKYKAYVIDEIKEVLNFLGSILWNSCTTITFINSFHTFLLRFYFYKNKFLNNWKIAIILTSFEPKHSFIIIACFVTLILDLYLGYTLTVTKVIKLYRILYYIKVDFNFIRLIVIIGKFLAISNYFYFNLINLFNSFRAIFENEPSFI